jgi:hypothetical protein
MPRPHWANRGNESEGIQDQTSVFTGHKLEWITNFDVWKRERGSKVSNSNLSLLWAIIWSLVHLPNEENAAGLH